MLNTKYSVKSKGGFSLKKILIIGIMFILISSNFVYGTEKSIILKETNDLNTDKSYIYGVFSEERMPLFLTKPLIFIRLVNKDTNETYVISFNFSKNLKIYEVPAGNYKISSFYGTKTDYGMKSEFISDENYEFNLKTDPALMNEFELHQGEIMYIGDYAAKKVFYLSPTTKIIHTDNYDNMKMMLEKNHPLDKFTVNHIDFQEINIEAYKYDEKLALSKDKCYLAGRFIFQRPFLSPSSYTIIIDDIWKKKIMKFGVNKSSDIRYFEAKPGEYLLELSLLYMSTIHDLGTFLPDNLKIPFTINPGEVIYLGEFRFVENEEFIGSASVHVKYQFDLEESRDIIKNHLADPNLIITSVNN